MLLSMNALNVPKDFSCKIQLHANLWKLSNTALAIKLRLLPPFANSALKTDSSKLLLHVL